MARMHSLWSPICCVIFLLICSRPVKSEVKGFRDLESQFLPRDARSASCGIAIVSRPSVCPSVTLVYRGHIGWTTSKFIIRIISLGSSLLGATTSPV